MKKFITYLGWTVLFGVILYIGHQIQVNLREVGNSTYNLVPYAVFFTCFPVLVGILLRASKWVKEIKEGSRWTFNVPKFLGICLPALYITFVPLVALTSFGQYILFYSELVLLANTNITTITGLIGGYVLLDCIRKK